MNKIFSYGASLLALVCFWYSCQKSKMNAVKTSVKDHKVFALPPGNGDVYEVPKNIAPIVEKKDIYLELRAKDGTVEKVEGIRLVYLGVNQEEQLFIVKEELVPVLENAKSSEEAFLRRFSELSEAQIQKRLAAMESGFEHSLISSALLSPKVIENLADTNSLEADNFPDWEQEFALSYRISMSALHPKEETPDNTDGGKEKVIVYVEKCYDKEGRQKKGRICASYQSGCGDGSFCPPDLCYKKCILVETLSMAVLSAQLYDRLDKLGQGDPDFWNNFLEKLASSKYQNYQAQRFIQAGKTVWADQQKLEISFVEKPDTAVW